MRQMRRLWFVGDADALGPAVFGVGLGAAKQRKRKIVLTQELEKMRK